MGTLISNALVLGLAVPLQVVVAARLKVAVGALEGYAVVLDSAVLVEVRLFEGGELAVGTLVPDSLVDAFLVLDQIARRGRGVIALVALVYLLPVHALNMSLEGKKKVFMMV